MPVELEQISELGQMAERYLLDRGWRRVSTADRSWLHPRYAEHQPGISLHLFGEAFALHVSWETYRARRPWLQLGDRGIRPSYPDYLPDAEEGSHARG